jgi:HEAT repeat protein
VSLRSLTVAGALVSLAGGASRAVTEPPPEPVRFGLYEWMATSPIVIAADVVADDGKFVRTITRTAIKGGGAVDVVALIDLRQANRDREVGTTALDLAKGRAYVLLLKASTRGKNEPYPVFDLVRGVHGVRPLPLEGSDATVAALVRLAAVQERNNDDFLWASLPGFLEDENPVLVDAALELYVKFRRETVALLPIVAPLLEHPRPDVRRRAALVLGRVLLRAGAKDVPERSDVVAELTGRARRDEDVTVRREATRALAALPDPGIDETLRAVARDDSDQDVRYEAEKSVFERSQAAAHERSD